METKKAVIPVKGMTCVNCAAAIQKYISKLTGDKLAETEKVRVTTDDRDILFLYLCYELSSAVRWVFYEIHRRRHAGQAC